VSKHSKFKKATPQSPSSIKPRIDRAIHEGRFQQALELAKQLYKYEPTPVHLALLKKVYLGRGKELRDRGATQDAATLYEAAVRIDAADAAWVDQLAVELARCGAVQRASNLVVAIPDSNAVQQIQALTVDAALQKQAQGKSLLAPALHADFDRILSAFQQVERGEDDAARAALQEIGLRSPFLEWKLLLRGLQAYYQNDDVRAVENWQRLSPDRMPARLVAPFRFHIDATYRAAQPPTTQMALQRQFDQVQGSLALQQLRTLRGTFADPEHLGKALHQAEALLPALRAEAPQLVPRLANCFYWALLETGPDDVPRYRRVFGAPPHDRDFHRLEAVACDKSCYFDDAHRAWQDYEKEVADNPDLWPEGQAQQVRALIWLHMGQNAAKVPSEKKLRTLPPMLRDSFPPMRPLTPAASKCFERSLELVPDQLEALEGLFLYYLHNEQPAKAVKAAQRLLAIHPDHLPTLEAYGNLCMVRGENEEALRVLQHALKTNPLDRDLRAQVGNADLLIARAAAEKKSIDEARPHYQAALSLLPADEHALVLCRWAAAEFKAGEDSRAEELLLQAHAHGIPLAVAYCMLTETIRLKLPKALKTRFDAAFKEGLELPPTAKDVVAVVSYLAALSKLAKPYSGAKTHQTKILKYVDRASKARFTAAQLEQLCYRLLSLKAVKRLTPLAKRGQREFPKDPVFPYLEAMSFRPESAFGPTNWKTQNLLEKADRLLAELPREQRREELQEEVKRQLTLLTAMNPLNRFGDLFGGGGFVDDFYDDEDDYDDDEFW
jgi:tetratricopeptide (TPR) repeat protein